MVRRVVVMSLLAGLIVVLATPGTAFAGKWWPIKNPAGKTEGYTKVWSSGKGVANPFKQIGSWDGANVHIVKERSNRWDAWMGATGLIRVNVTRHKSGVRWRITGADSGTLCGRVLHKKGRWVTQMRRNGRWRTLGWVNDRCPAWLAGGATYVSLVQ